MNAPIKQAVSLSALARAALAENEGNKAQAIEELDARLRDDKALRRGLISEALELAARVSINLETLSKRSKIAHAADRNGLGQERVQALASGLSQSLLEFPMADGTPLRLAGRDLIELTRDGMAARAATMARRANWLTAILPNVPQQGVAGDVFDDDALHELWEKTNA